MYQWGIDTDRYQHAQGLYTNIVIQLKQLRSMDLSIYGVCIKAKARL